MLNREELIRERAYELYELRTRLGLTDFTSEMNWLDAEWDVDHEYYPREDKHSVMFHDVFNLRG